MAGRVRWFFGLARNSGECSLPIIGTPCEVPEPRKMKKKDIRSSVTSRSLTQARHRRMRRFQNLPQGSAGMTRGARGDLLRSAFGDELAALITGVRAEIHHPIR